MMKIMMMMIRKIMIWVIMVMFTIMMMSMTILISMITLPEAPTLREVRERRMKQKCLTVAIHKLAFTSRHVCHIPFLLYIRNSSL